MKTTELCTIEVDGSNLELAPPVSGELVEPLWKLWRRMPAYIPDGVNKAQWMTAAASAANQWFNAARRTSQAKNVQIDLGSLAKCVFNASVIGLPMVDQLGYQHLVPMHVNKNQNGGWIECQLWTGYKGYLELARDAGVNDVVTPEVVWRDEPFKYWVDENGKHFRHEPRLDRPDQIDIKEIEAAYVVTTTPRGHHDFEIVHGSTLRNLARRGNVWKSHPVQMCKKTAIRAIAGRWPQTDRMAAAMRLNDQVDAEQTQSALVSYQGNGVSAAVVEKTTAKVPDWMRKLKTSLAKCKSKEAVNKLRNKYSDNDADLVNQVCDAYLEASGLLSTPAEPTEPPPAARDDKVCALVNQVCDAFLASKGFDKNKPTETPPAAADDIEAANAELASPSPEKPAATEKPKRKRGRPRKKAEPKPQEPPPEKSADDREAEPTDAEIIDKCESDLAACKAIEEINAIVFQYADLFPEKKTTVELLASIAERKLGRQAREEQPPETPEPAQDEPATVKMDDMSTWDQHAVEKALRRDLAKCDSAKAVSRVQRKYLADGPADEAIIEFIYDACEQREDDLAWEAENGS